MAVAAPLSDRTYEALASGCAMVDREDDGKLALSGPDAASALDGQVTNDVAGLAPGTGCDAALLTNKGKMVAPLRVLRTDDELLLLTERVTLQPLFDALRRALVGWDAELHKRTLQLDRITLLGPRSDEVAGVTDLGGAEHEHVAASSAGGPVRAVRVLGGLELLCAAPDGDAVRAALAAAGAVPVPVAVAEVARVEAGRPRFGFELDDGVIPQEAGLNERFVSFTKGCYVGQETVARLFYRGKPNRSLRGLTLSEPVAPGTELRLGDRVVGRVGSVVASPRLGPIALALVRREVAVGDEVRAGESATATVVELPFAAAGPSVS